MEVIRITECSRKIGISRNNGATIFEIKYVTGIAFSK